MTEIIRIAIGVFFLWGVVRSLQWASKGGSRARAAGATTGSAQAAAVVQGVLGSLLNSLRDPKSKQGWNRTAIPKAKAAAKKKRRGTKVGPDGKKGYVDPVRPATDEEIGHWREVADGFADLVGLSTRFRPWRKDKPKKKRFWHTETRSAREDTAARRKAEAEAAAAGTAKPVPAPEEPAAIPPHPPRHKPGVCVKCGNVGAKVRPTEREPLCDPCFALTLGPSETVVDPAADPHSRSVYVPQHLELFEAGDVIARQKFESIVAIEAWLRAVYEGAQTCTTMYQTLASRLWPEMNIDVIVTRHLADAGALQPQVVRGIGEAADAITMILGMSQRELLEKGIKVPHEDLLAEAGQAVIVPTFFELVNTLAQKDFDKDVRVVQLLLKALADASEQQQIMYSTLARRLSEPDMNLDASVVEGLFLAARYQGQISMELAQSDAALVMLCNMVLRDLAASPYQAPTARPSS